MHIYTYSIHKNRKLVIGYHGAGGKRGAYIKAMMLLFGLSKINIIR